MSLWSINSKLCHIHQGVYVLSALICSLAGVSGF